LSSTLFILCKILGQNIIFQCFVKENSKSMKDVD
jgi:hypothetical protein